MSAYLRFFVRLCAFSEGREAMSKRSLLAKLVFAIAAAAIPLSASAATITWPDDVPGNLTLGNGDTLLVNGPVSNPGTLTINYGATIDGIDGILQASSPVILGGGFTFGGAGGSGDFTFASDVIVSTYLNIMANENDRTLRFGGQVTLGEASGPVVRWELMGGSFHFASAIHSLDSSYEIVISLGGTNSAYFGGVSTSAFNVTLDRGAVVVGANSALGTGKLTINGGKIVASDQYWCTLGNSEVAINGNTVLDFGEHSNLNFGNAAISVNNARVMIEGASYNPILFTGNGSLTFSGNSGLDCTSSAVVFNQRIVFDGGSGNFTFGGTGEGSGNLTFEYAELNVLRSTMVFGEPNRTLTFRGDPSYSAITLGDRFNPSIPVTWILHDSNYSFGTGIESFNPANEIVLRLHDGTATFNSKSDIGLNSGATSQFNMTLDSGTVVVGANSALGTGKLTINGGKLVASDQYWCTLGNSEVVING
ncbi:MAG: hypothetical protein FWD53_12970, partial [Phycisphaerales bacterium]|nr:hypothetical protein [Phycisphaerales bacterium]